MGKGKKLIAVFFSSLGTRSTFLFLAFFLQVLPASAASDDFDFILDVFNIDLNPPKAPVKPKPAVAPKTAAAQPVTVPQPIVATVANPAGATGSTTGAAPINIVPKAVSLEKPTSSALPQQNASTNKPTAIVPSDSARFEANSKPVAIPTATPDKSTISPRTVATVKPASSGNPAPTSQPVTAAKPAGTPQANPAPKPVVAAKPPSPAQASVAPKATAPASPAKPASSTQPVAGAKPAASLQANPAPKPLVAARPASPAQASAPTKATTPASPAKPASPAQPVAVAKPATPKPASTPSATAANKQAPGAGAKPASIPAAKPALAEKPADKKPAASDPGCEQRKAAAQEISKQFDDAINGLKNQIKDIESKTKDVVSNLTVFRATSQCLLEGWVPGIGKIAYGKVQEGLGPAKNFGMSAEQRASELPTCTANGCVVRSQRLAGLIGLLNELNAAKQKLTSQDFCSIDACNGSFSALQSAITPISNQIVQAQKTLEVLDNDILDADREIKAQGGDLETMAEIGTCGEKGLVPIAKKGFDKFDRLKASFESLKRDMDKRAKTASQWAAAFGKISTSCSSVAAAPR